MSHATVMIKVTAKRLAAHWGDADNAIAEMMAPYDEGTKDEQFIQFVDEEDEIRQRYQAESTTKIRTPEGDLLWSWDERFRVPGRFGIGSGTHRVPDDCAEAEVPFRELYSTLEAFADDYMGHSGRDPKTGRYGHYRNPSAKWDWYQIGGRRRGFFPVKPDAWDTILVGEPGAFDNEQTPGHGDVVHLADIDFDHIERTMRERAEKFWKEWQSWLAGTYKSEHPFDSPREMALRIGLLRVEQGPALTDHCQRAISWDWLVPADDCRAGWHDVVRLIDRDKFLADYIDCFNPIKTYAALDNDGWHAPGEMGWWGCSSDEPDGYVKFAREFMGRFVKTAGPDDLLVVVDYHI